MAEYLVEETTLTDIADAIREQTGDENPIMLSNFANEIASIQGGGSVNYSTTEHEIGTWIDGSTVYERTYTGSISGNVTTISALSDNIHLVGGEAGIVKSDTAQMLLGFLGKIDSWASGVHVSNGSLYLYTADEVKTGTYYVTIRYIKVSAQEVSP